jgi:hypothetical protein
VPAPVRSGERKFYAAGAPAGDAIRQVRVAASRAGRRGARQAP